MKYINSILISLAIVLSPVLVTKAYTSVNAQGYPGQMPAATQSIANNTSPNSYWINYNGYFKWAGNDLTKTMNVYKFADGSTTCYILTNMANSPVALQCK